MVTTDHLPRILNILRVLLSTKCSRAMQLFCEISLGTRKLARTLADIKRKPPNIFFYEKAPKILQILLRE